MNVNFANDTGLPTDMMNRRAVLSGAASFAAALGVGGASASHIQPEVSDLDRLVTEWQAAWDGWIEAADKPGAGNFDTPDCIYWDAEKERLLDLIQSYPIKTKADAKALSKFVWIDSDAINSEFPVVPRWALKRLIDWAAAT